MKRCKRKDEEASAKSQSNPKRFIEEKDKEEYSVSRERYLIDIQQRLLEDYKETYGNLIDGA